VASHHDSQGVTHADLTSRTVLPHSRISFCGPSLPISDEQVPLVVAAFFHGPDLAVNCGDQPWGTLRTPAIPLEVGRIFTFTLFAWEIPRRASQFSPLKMIAPECQSVFMLIAPPLWVVSGGFYFFNKRGSENADRSPRAFFTE
jgi:hypothetical protein